MVPKATPSVPVSQLKSLLDLTVLDADSLRPKLTSVSVGSGRFGNCVHMILKGTFDVCVKTLSIDYSVEAVKVEAHLMCILNSGDFTPHFFGISQDRRAIIMSLILFEGQPLSLHSALESGMHLEADRSLLCLLRISHGLDYIHSKGILHNDLKLDNVVLCKCEEGFLKPYIIDLGKMCKVDSARKYFLSEEECQRYKIEHSQIAPDLRDGHVKQSTATDVYSLGRIIKKMNRCVIKDDKISIIVKQCLLYHSHSRPSMKKIIESLGLR